MCCQISSWLVNLYRAMYCKSSLSFLTPLKLSHLLQRGLPRMHRQSLPTLYWHPSPYIIKGAVMRVPPHHIVWCRMFGNSLCIAICPCILLEICGRHVASELAVYRHMSPRSACIVMYCHSWRALAVYMHVAVCHICHGNIWQHVAILHWLSKPCSPSMA